MFSKPTRSAAALLAVLLGTAGSAMAQSQSVVVTWSEAALREVRLGKLGPPVVARALAVAHTCMYDAWAAYDTTAMPVSSTVPRRPAGEVTAHNKTKAVSHAAYQCLSNLFPAGQTRLADTLRSLGFDPNDTQTSNLTYGAGVGNAAAAAVLASRRFDGSNQYGDLAPGAYGDYTGYVPVNAPAIFCLPLSTFACPPNAVDPWRWQPLTGPTGAVQKFAAAQWANVRGFALPSASQFDRLPEVAAGPRYLQSGANYQSEVDQIVQVSGALNPWQKLLVEYWADGPDSELPPGHWGLYAQYVAKRDFNSATSLDRDVKMFFAMHNASFDAGIIAWRLKRNYNGVRPITAVRYARQATWIYAWGGPGQPNQWINGSKWSPYNPGSNLSPPFPGWVSGHSIFSASSAQVLRSFTGSDSFNYTTLIPANFGRVEPGVPAVPTQLSYATFTQAANDAAASRLLAGIHFNDDNTLGLSLGTRVGQQAWRQAQFLFQGGLSHTPITGVGTGAPGCVQSDASIARLDCVVVGSDGALFHSVLQDGQWSGWARLGGSFVANEAPSCTSWGPGRVDCFVRGTDGALWSAWGASGTLQLSSMGGQITEAASCVAPEPNRLQCMVRGGPQLAFVKRWDGTRWTEWINAGGNLASAPSCASWAPGRVDCFALGPAADLFVQTHQTSTGQMSDWAALGGVIRGRPSCVSAGSGRLSCYVRGTDDGLWERTWNNNGWTAWALIAGTTGRVAAPPSCHAARDGTQSQCTVVAGDGSLLSVSGRADSLARSSDLRTVAVASGGAALEAPACTLRGPASGREIDCVVRQARDGSLSHLRFRLP